MNDGERRLLQRILESPHFSQAASLRRILVHLCERSDRDGAAQPKEYEIAVEALGRQPSFDPKADPIVRVSIAAIRQRLQAYFDVEGKTEALRLDIPKGVYRSVFSKVPARPAGLQEAPPSPGARSRFWEPYLSGQTRNILVFTDVLFFRDDAGNYLRNIFVNNLATGAGEIRQRAPAAAFHNLKPSYHFVSAGEVQAMLALVRLFAQMRAPLDVCNSRFTSWNELQSSNLILLGSSRTNAFIDALQAGNNFVITADSIRNLEPRAGEEGAYAGQRHMEGKLEKAVEPAIVTRRPGLAPGAAVTMISANHGRGIEGAAQFLGMENELAAVLEGGDFDIEKMPAHFQLLLNVHLVDFDEEVICVEHVAHRVISASGTPENSGPMSPVGVYHP